MEIMHFFSEYLQTRYNRRNTKTAVTKQILKVRLSSLILDTTYKNKRKL